MSISLKKDTKKTNIKHNNREFTERGKERNDHIDFSRSDRNVYLVKEDLRQVYEREFGPAKDRYNEKQQRRDRKIEDYYKHVQQGKKNRPQQEMIVQIGGQEHFENDDPNREMAKEVLQEWFQEFQQRNPQLKIYNAVIHDDEASPHMHMNFVPVATGYQKGMDTQVSFDRAIKQQDETLHPTHPFEEWREREIGWLEEKINARGIDRELVGTTDYEDMNEFKQKTRELKELQDEIEVEKDTLKPMVDFSNTFHDLTWESREKRSMGFTGARKVEMPKEKYDKFYQLAHDAFDRRLRNSELKETNEVLRKNLEFAHASNKELRDQNEKLKENNRHLTNENKILHKAFDFVKEQFSNQKQQFADMVGRAKGKAIVSLNLKRYPTNIQRDDEQAAMNKVFQEKQKERQHQQKKSRGQGPDLGM